VSSLPTDDDVEAVSVDAPILLRLSFSAGLTTCVCATDNETKDTICARINYRTRGGGGGGGGIRGDDVSDVVVDVDDVAFAAGDDD
jgi:hypothetical protein